MGAICRGFVMLTRSTDLPAYSSTLIHVELPRTGEVVLFLHNLISVHIALDPYDHGLKRTTQNLVEQNTARFQPQRGIGPGLNESACRRETHGMLSAQVVPERAVRELSAT